MNATKHDRGTKRTGPFERSRRAYERLQMPQHLAVAEKQGADFHLRAPDEPAARAAFESANPTLVAKRHNIIADLTPPEMFPDDEPDDDAADDTAAEDDADLDDAAT